MKCKDYLARFGFKKSVRVCARACARAYGRACVWEASVDAA